MKIRKLIQTQNRKIKEKERDTKIFISSEYWTLRKKGMEQIETLEMKFLRLLMDFPERIGLVIKQ